MKTSESWRRFRAFRVPSLYKVYASASWYMGFSRVPSLRGSRSEGGLGFFLLKAVWRVLLGLRPSLGFWVAGGGWHGRAHSRAPELP